MNTRSDQYNTTLESAESADVLLSNRRSNFRPMQTSGIGNHIRRAYRESGPQQWVRETVINSYQSGATRVHFAVEWQGVARKNVYRRLMVDNGCGMDPKQLVEFFNTMGASRHEVGGEENNFGVGAKSSLLPWNSYGLVIVSRHDNTDSMIWMEQNEAGEYGLKSDAVEPKDDEQHGINWARIFPNWVGTHGTAIVLLGNEPTEDTIRGDTSREPYSPYGLLTYLNKRLFEIPDEIRVSVDRLLENRSQWPKNRNEKDAGFRTDRASGARALILGDGKASGKMRDSGTIILKDKTRVEWFLWDGARPYRSTKECRDGFIGVVYTSNQSLPEIYDFETSPARFRQFGITDSAVRKRVWLLLTPQRSENNGPGVFPNGARNALLVQGNPHADDGDPLPFSEWGKEFCYKMPDPISKAIKAAWSGKKGTINDKYWAERLRDRFGNMWKKTVIKKHQSGSLTSTPTSLGSPWRKKPAKPNLETVVVPPVDPPQPRKKRIPRKNLQLTIVGLEGPGSRGKTSTVPVDLPTFRWMPDDGTFEPGMLAAWQPDSPTDPKGVVLLNQNHTVFNQLIEKRRSEVAPHDEDRVEKLIHQAYGETAVAKIAHSEYFKHLVSDAVIVTNDMRSQAALTMSLIGLISEDALITRRLSGIVSTSGKFSKKRKNG